jgi:hypothetical protein
MERHGHPPCPRCYGEEEVLRPWRGYRIACSLWIVGLVVLGALSAILASDILVMLPLTVAYLFGAGPVFAMAKEQPTCRSCGLARPSPGWHETPCRPVRGLPDASTSTRLKLRPSAAARAESDEDSGVRPLPGAHSPDRSQP